MTLTQLIQSYGITRKQAFIVFRQLKGIEQLNDSIRFTNPTHADWLIVCDVLGCEGIEA